MDRPLNQQQIYALLDPEGARRKRRRWNKAHAAKNLFCVCCLVFFLIEFIN